MFGHLSAPSRAPFFSDTFKEPPSTIPLRDYDGQEPVSYFPQTDGNMRRFIDSHKYTELQTQYDSGLDDIHRFLGSKEQDASSLALFKELLIPEAVGGSNDTHLELLYREGKKALDEIRSELYDNRLPLKDRREIIANLPKDLAVCIPGALTNLIGVAKRFQLSGPGIENAARRIYNELLEQLLREFSLAKHGHEAGYTGNEIHYINGYRNYLAESLPHGIIEDLFIPDSVKRSKMRRACAAYVHSRLTEHAIVRGIASEARAAIQLELPEDRSISADELTVRRQAEIFRAAEAYGYNDKDVGLFLEPSDDGARSVLRRDKWPLERDVARKLRSARMFDHFKSRTIASAQDFELGLVRERAIKAIGETIYYKIRIGEKSIHRKPQIAHRKISGADLWEPWVSKSGASELLPLAAALPELQPRDVVLDDEDRDVIVEESRPRNTIVLNSEPPLYDLLLHGADANAADPETGQSSLAIAAYQNRRLYVEALLKQRGIDIDAGDHTGTTALSYAVQTSSCPDSYEIIDCLIAKGANTELADVHGKRPLQHAVSAHRVRAVDQLLAAGASIDAACNKGRTVLHDVVIDGDEDMLRHLLAKEGKVNSRDMRGWTPLLYAVANNRNKMITELANNEAYIWGNPDDAVTPLTLAAEKGNVAAIERLGGKMIDSILTEPDAESGINEPRANGDTALHIAVTRNDINAVKALLDLGADCTIKDANERTALHIARACADDRIERMIKKAIGPSRPRNRS